MITEVIASLTGSPNPSGYLKKIKSRDIGLSEGWGHTLEIKTKDKQPVLVVEIKYSSKVKFSNSVVVQ